MKTLVSFFLFIPLAAHAEVMDKELSLTMLWVVTVFIAMTACVAMWRRPRLLILPLVLGGALWFGQLADIADPLVGSAIRREAGFSYIVSSWISPLVTVVGVAVGAYLRKHGHAAQQALAADARKASRG